MSGINILILSCGSRNKIVQYFKNELAGKGLVLATDCSELAPALYAADKSFIVPRVDEMGYLEAVLSICEEYRVKAVLSLIDPELSKLSRHRQEFIDIGVSPVVSDLGVVERCLNKYEMNRFLIEHGFKTAKSYLSKKIFYTDLESGEIGYPVLVKPVQGSASLNINVVNTGEELEMLLGQFDNLLIQEFMEGTEYGADVYIDLISKEPVAIFTKEKILMRAGETDKSVSVKDEQLFQLIKRFVKKAELQGIIDIDLFKVNGEYYISEVNPRFGGGYPHAHGCGVNIPGMIIRNIEGKVNKDTTGDYDGGVYMMKFNEVIIKR